MAYIDILNQFSSGQTLTATGNSTDYIDFGSDRDVGPGDPLWIVLAVSACDGASGDETYSFAVETDDNTSFSSAATIGTITVTRGVAPTQYVLGFPYANERYVRLRATLGGTTPSVTFTGYLTNQTPRSWAAYPDAI
jgi:hypothetical protein